MSGHSVTDAHRAGLDDDPAVSSSLSRVADCRDPGTLTLGAPG